MRSRTRFAASVAGCADLQSKIQIVFASGWICGGRPFFERLDRRRHTAMSRSQLTTASAASRGLRLGVSHHDGDRVTNSAPYSWASGRQAPMSSASRLWSGHPAADDVAASQSSASWLPLRIPIHGPAFFSAARKNYRCFFDLPCACGERQNCGLLHARHNHVAVIPGPCRLHEPGLVFPYAPRGADVPSISHVSNSSG